MDPAMDADGVVKLLPKGIKIIRLLKKGDLTGVLLIVTPLCLSLLSWLFELANSGKNTLHQVQVIILIVGVVLLVLFLRLLVVFWRRPPLIDIPKNVLLPRSVRGVSPFIEADGDFFQYLGRGAEIERLVHQTLDGEFPMVVLRGKPGSGKTSLLRAGLRHQLRK